MSSVWLVAMMSLSAITTLSRLADIGPAPPTIMVNSSGKLFDLTSLKGKVVIVSFVYTTCNGTCPATTLTLSRVQKVLRQAKLWGTSVEFVSISLDPERDTPDVLKRYAELFNADLANWNFLTGSRSDVQSVIAAWGMWARIGPSGALDHPSRIFLLDPQGHQREIYNLEFLKTETVIQDVKELLAEVSKN
ncbi:MAG TPA: SCO family protein [Isosphaeraceae bacterium]|nr:SCO family protein [Isosphaeraceae bacterium]